MQKTLFEVADAIESAQYKYALQVCNKSLKKAKAPGDIAQFSAFKAVALLSLDNGKDKEANALVDQVRKTGAYTEQLIATLTTALDMLGRGSDVVALYEDAAKKSPKDEDLARHWFRQMILRNNIDGARKAAMVLNKLPHQRKYFYWVLTTWKTKSPDRQIRALSLSMASKLVNHALSSPNLLPETISETLLLLSVASADAALRFLQEDGKKWTSDIEVRRTYIDLLYNAAKFGLLRDFCEDEIEQGVDDWKVVKGWIDGHVGVFNLDASTEYILSSRKDINVSTGMKVLLHKLEEKYSRRNFALGTIYLGVACYPDMRVEGLDPPQEQCTRYFKCYHRKSACFRDIQSYVANLSKEDKSKFLADVASVSDETETALHKVFREINVLKFDYMLRPWILDDLIRCWEVYIEGTTASEPTEDTDLLPGDDALSLGCYTLVKQYNATNDSKYLLQACICLEAGLEKSNHNFQFKLLLIRVYLLLGAIPLAIMLYASLDIKQIQNDTLSHFLLSHVSTLYPDQLVLYNMALARYIYSTNEEETPPQIWTAFAEGTFHNVPDFWDLWMRLRHSLTRAVLYREREFVAMLTKTEREPLEDIDEELWDQRDLTVLTDCELPGDPSPEEFTRIGPLERVCAIPDQSNEQATTTKVLAHSLKMIHLLEKASPKTPVDNMDSFLQLRSSKAVWDTFKQETTPAEYTATELIWEIYEARIELSQGKTDKARQLVATLSTKLPFDGQDTRDITWESLHGTLLTVRVCYALRYLLPILSTKKDESLKSTLADTATTALTACVDKLEIKKNMCSARSDHATLIRLSDSIVEDVGYMEPMKQLLSGESVKGKLKALVETQEKVIGRAQEITRAEIKAIYQV